MNKAAIYARVSTVDKQDYQRQINELYSAASKDGYKKDDIDLYPERISGYKRTEEREELQRLQQKIEEDNSYYKCIYTWTISRIGRNPSHTRQIIDRWTDLKVPVYILSHKLRTLDQNGNRDMVVNIILQISMEFANEEAQMFKMNSKSGLLNSARMGRAGGGRNLPYGYMKDTDKRLIINEKESKIIIRIFNLYKEGNGIKVISRLLNEERIPTRVNISYDKNQVIKFKKIPKLSSDIRWSDKQIYDIIRNPIYMGKRRFKNEFLSVPSIISEELFEECQNIRKNKRTRNFTTTYTYLLKDIIICGVCGRNFYARFKPIKGGDKVYKCSSSLTIYKSCRNCAVNIKLIESVLFNEIVSSKSIIKYLDDRKGLKKEIESTISNIKNQLSVNEAELRAKEDENNRLLTIFLRSSITIDRFEINQDRIQNETKVLSNSIKLLKKELNSKTKILCEIDKNPPSERMIRDAKNDRKKLSVIFHQLINKIIVNKIDKDLVLICLFPKFEGEPLNTTIKYLLDLSGIRKNNQVFRYKGMYVMENDPVFNENNILMTNLNDIKDEIINDKHSQLNRMLESNFENLTDDNLYQWTEVPKDSILEIF